MAATSVVASFFATVKPAEDAQGLPSRPQMAACLCRKCGKLLSERACPSVCGVYARMWEWVGG